MFEDDHQLGNNDLLTHGFVKLLREVANVDEAFALVRLQELAHRGVAAVLYLLVVMEVAIVEWCDLVFFTWPEFVQARISCVNACWAP